jgi:hypothetical protein
LTPVRKRQRFRCSSILSIKQQNPTPEVCSRAG